MEDGTGERYLTKPCTITLDAGGTAGTITLTEGKYHQVKRLFEAAGNKVTLLERTAFAGLTLDTLPERGQWRYLTQSEEQLLFAQANKSAVPSD